jgi:hypothetical protein
MAASRNLTPEQLKARASLAAYVQWSKEVDRTERTRPKREAFEARFEREARAQHPNASDQAIALMVEAARKAHFTRLAFLSSKARAAKKAGGRDGP